MVCGLQRLFQSDLSAASGIHARPNSEGVPYCILARPKCSGRWMATYLMLHRLELTYLRLWETRGASGGDDSGVDKPAVTCGEEVNVCLCEHVRLLTLPSVLNAHNKILFCNRIPFLPA